MTYDLACSTAGDNTILMVDFNVDISTSNGNKLTFLCNSINLTFHVHEPTRITERTTTCLNQIMTNIPNFVKNVKVLPPVGDNDHSTLAADLLFRLTKIHVFKYLYGYTLGIILTTLRMN